MFLAQLPIQTAPTVLISHPVASPDRFLVGLYLTEPNAQVVDIDTAMGKEPDNRRLERDGR